MKLITKTFYFKAFIRTFKLKRSQNLPSDFVTKWLCRDDCNFLTYSLVGVEIQRQTSVVLLDNDSGGFFDSLRPDTTLNRNKRSNTWSNK